MGRMVDRFGVPAPEAIVVLAADTNGDGPAWRAGALRAMLDRGQVERHELEEALVLARGAFERDASGGNGWEPDDGPNFGQAVVVLAAALR